MTKREIYIHNIIMAIIWLFAMGVIISALDLWDMNISKYNLIYNFIMTIDNILH